MVNRGLMVVVEAKTEANRNANPVVRFTPVRVQPLQCSAGDRQADSDRINDGSPRIAPSACK